MPIFSAARGLPYLQDSLFKRPTVFDWSHTPDYAFHFLPPQDGNNKSEFEGNFFFDNCESFDKPSRDVNVLLPDGNEVDINDHSLHYLRLYALKYLGRDDPKYYLAPWITVPYNKSTGLFAPVVRDTSPTAPQGTMKSGPIVIRLRVVPHSIYLIDGDNYVKRAVKDASDRAASSGQPAPTLTLSSSNSAVITAIWSKSSGSTISEIECAREQNIEITVCDSSAPYNYQEYLEITNDAGLCVGRVYFLFLKIIQHQVIFFEAKQKVISPTKNSANELTITMPSVTDPMPTGYLVDLNSILRKLGIEHAAANPTLTTSSVNVTYPKDIGGTDASVNFEDKEARISTVLSTVNQDFVERVDNTLIPEYAFVFFAKWALNKPPSGSGGSYTTGISYLGSRVSCIYEHSPETLCHEVAHGLGLPHYFFQLRVANGLVDAISETQIRDCVLQMRATARDILVNDLNILTQAAFYTLHNNMNFGDSCVEFGTTAQAQRKFGHANVDRYVKFATANLMDYQPQGATAKKEKLVKHQVEFVRFFVRNNLYGV